MKKNLSLLISLILAPLISSSSLFSMDTPLERKEKIDTPTEQTKNKFNAVLDQLARRKREKEEIKITNSELPTEDVTIDLPAPIRQKSSSELLAIAKEEIQSLDNLQIAPSTDASADLSELMESYIPAPLPKPKGFSYFWRAVLIAKSHPAVIKEMLACETNEFDPSNEDHLKLLHEALNRSINSSNIEDVMFIINTCQKKYTGQLELDPVTARKAHKLLTDTIDNKRNALEKKLEGINASFAASNIAVIEALQKTIAQQQNELTNISTKWNQIGKATVEKRNNEIAELKKTTAAIHFINKRLKLAKGEACSDEDCIDNKSSSLSKSAVYISPDNIAAKYTPAYTLNQIGMTRALEDTAQSNQKLVADVKALHAAAQNIKFGNN